MIVILSFFDFDFGELSIEIAIQNGWHFLNTQSNRKRSILLEFRLNVVNQYLSKSDISDNYGYKRQKNEINFPQYSKLKKEDN